MTNFRGRVTGFNRTGNNVCAPNEFGPPAVTFKGRGALPPGGFKRFPGAVADIDDGNRRLAKAKYGAGDGDGVSWTDRTAFGGKHSTAGGARTYDTKGGKGSGFRKGTKT